VVDDRQVQGPAGEWWRESVIYQVYVRSFSDSDGDGVGDLPGIRARLGYLADLGVDAVWITPFYRSPMADAGYDVADYRDVDPSFGTLADAEALVADAHRLGLRVLVDIVPNHTSDEHEWFRAALASAPGSRERDRYVFRAGRGPGGDGPPTNWPSVFGGPAWTRLPTGEWYLHSFTPKQPDLNWDNPEVRAEFEAILSFWLDRGVDGFRIDVAHGLVKDLRDPLRDVAMGDGRPEGDDDHPSWDRDGVHDVYRAWRRVLDAYADPPRAMVAEAWTQTTERRMRYVRPDELHQAFNFDFLLTPWRARPLRAQIDDELAGSRAVGASPTWVVANHDATREATRYGRVQPHERFGTLDAQRRVSASDASLGRRRARAAALLLLGLPGSAYVYQGQELGLPEVLDLADEDRRDPVWYQTSGRDVGRDGCRIPLPWTASGPSYGFGTGGAWLPQPAGWGTLSVESQRGDPDSTLELHRRAVRVRRDEAALRRGSFAWLASSEDVLLFARVQDGVTVTCAVNLGDSSFDLSGLGEVLVASVPLDDPTVLPADASVWCKAGTATP
jgi:alpha-glucosidase